MKKLGKIITNTIIKDCGGVISIEGPILRPLFLFIL